MLNYAGLFLALKEALMRAEFFFDFGVFRKPGVFRKAEIVCGFAFGSFVVGKSAFRYQFGGGIGDEPSLSG